MRNQEKGIATLAVVSGIAMVVALFSVAVIKSGVNEVNKANNLVELAQDKAHARASIDCAAGLFKQLGLNPSTMVAGDFSDCKSDASTVFGIVDGGSLWTISAQHGYATSRFSVRQTSSKAAFRTAGSVEITGGNSWAPAAGDVVTIDGVQYVECTAIVAGGTITIDVGSSAAAFDTLKPIDSSLDCAPTHDTHIAAGSGSVTDGFGKDMVSNADIESIFEEIFGRPKSEWESVRSEEGFYVINTGSAITNKAAVEGCGAAIKTAINGDPAADPPIGKHDKIWVMGDCMLNGVTHAGDAFQSPLVVIQNGIVGANGAIDGFRGTVLQFTVDYPNSNLATSWGKNSGGCADGAMNALCLELSWSHDSARWAALPFYFRGGYGVTGSFIVDIPNTTALITGAMSLGFDEGTFDELPSSTPKVLKGSFHDL